jgi:hypothetical protein
MTCTKSRVSVLLTAQLPRRWHQGTRKADWTTLSEKLEYLFFSPRTFQCYFMNIHNKYFGKIFSALCVDVFTELFRISPNFDISWYMTKYSEVHLKNCLLIHYWSISHILYSLDGLVDWVLASYTGGPWIKSWEEPFFNIVIKPRNIPKYIANN